MAALIVKGGKTTYYSFMKNDIFFVKMYIVIIFKA